MKFLFIVLLCYCVSVFSQGTGNINWSKYKENGDTTFYLKPNFDSLNNDTGNTLFYNTNNFNIITTSSSWSWLDNSLATRGYSYFSVGGAKGTLLYNDIDGPLTIEGDTMALVRELFKRSEKYSDLYYECLNNKADLYDVVVAGVNFANTLPAYLLPPINNYKWDKYYKLLKREGFYLKLKK